jgi:hypothetical protein
MRILFRIVIFILCAACTSQESFDAEKVSIVKSYRPDGRLYATVAYVNNKPHGTGLQYHPNQKLYIEAEYSNGFKHGVAKQYYQSGVLYSETPFTQGKIDGIVKKYHKDGKLKAEIPYKNDFECIGLKEYILTGEPRPHYPEIIITPENRLLSGAGYLLHIALSERVQQASFFMGDLTDGCLNETLTDVLRTGKDTGVIEIMVKPGESVKANINIIARIETIAGNVLVTQQDHALAINYAD